MSESSDHWDDIYRRRAAESLSWFQAKTALSLELVDALQLPRGAPIIDVGAGTSRFVDGLLERGYSDLTLLDLSMAALESVRERVTPKQVALIVADVTSWHPARQYALWHDRAVFHFLTQPAQRDAYRRVMARALAPRAHVVIASFAPDGPQRCNGLPVQRYGVEELAEQFDELLRVVAARREIHVTPTGAEQAFVYVRFARR